MLSMREMKKFGKCPESGKFVIEHELNSETGQVVKVEADTEDQAIEKWGDIVLEESKMAAFRHKMYLRNMEVFHKLPKKH